MDMGQMWMGIAEAALNYIVVSTISSMNAKQTVSDVKTDLRTTKEDLMSELKDTRETVLSDIDASMNMQLEMMKAELATLATIAGKKNEVFKLWEQIYDPLNNIWLSALIASVPILFFILCLTVFKISGYLSGIASTIVAIGIAILFYDMPIFKAFMSAVHGVLSGLYPVATIVIFAIFLYKLTVKTGKFEIIKDSITSITSDKRIQVLLIAYCFGAFLEGAAGFGAPVAITAIILVGLGFEPIKAGGLCLIANIAGGSFGAMGIPVTTPAGLTGLDPLDVARETSLIIPLISFIVAFLLVYLVDGFKGIKETYPSILVCGGTFAIVQYAILNTLGAVLVDILSASISLIVLTLFEVLRAKERKYKSNLKEVTLAWLPFIILTLMVILFSLDPIKNLFKTWVIDFPITGIHDGIMRTSPIVVIDSPYTAIFSIGFASTSIAILLASAICIAIFKIRREVVKNAFSETMKELTIPILTICGVLAFAYVCNYSGMSSTLGLAFADTGKVFPLFSPVLGWIGVFLTGSVVNSGSLFSPLQSITADQIGISQTAMVASNVMGGDMAKMISPQSVAVACASVGLVGRENDLFKFTIKISVIFLLIVGILNLVINL